MGITTSLAFDLFQIQKLSNQDKEQLRLLIIDFFAASYAGYKQNRDFNHAVERVVCCQRGVEEAFVFLQRGRYPAAKAAFMNSIYGHGAELDDGNKKAMGHVGVHVIPAVFALADKLNSTNEEVLVALATGYEAYIRISSAAQPGMVQRGFHSTGMAGTLACSAACARLYHLDAQGIEDAIALATTLSGGLLSYGESRPAIKPLNPAKAAENGIFAAMLASEGVKGPLKALEGPNGWFHAVTSKIEKDMLKGGEHLLIHECYFKLYPSCRHTHCGIEAAINLHKRIKAEDIKAVYVYIYPNAIKLAGQIHFPQNQDETKFSIHYTLACALQYGTYGIKEMEYTKLSDEIVNLINRIHLISDEAMEDRSKNIRGTRVEVVKKNGEVIKEAVLVPKGDPEKPLGRQDILGKLEECALGCAGQKTLEKLIRMIEDLDGDGEFINPISVTGEL